MSFSTEYSKVLSTILAKENIFVETDPHAETASFNMESRIIVLPEWNGSHELQRFLTCHEVGHAIHTPFAEWTKAIQDKEEKDRRNFQRLLNVVEDCRIDRLMQSNYPIMQKWYYQGTKEIFNGTKPNLDNLPDRINIFFKTKPIGNVFNVSFTSQEQAIVDRIEKIKTFKEVIEVAELLFEETDEEIEAFCVVECNAVYTPKKQNYVYLPDEDYKKHIKTKYFSPTRQQRNASVHGFNEMANHLANIFERKRSARNLSRTMVAKTGMLDMLKIREYLHNEDLFRRKMIIPKQKNHGMIMIIDGSGSMLSQFAPLMDHMLLLSLFCKRVNIPFYSYVFSQGGTKSKLTNSNFSLIPIMSSLDTKKNIVAAYHNFRRYAPSGGTPLTDTLHLAKTMLLDFREKYNLDIMNLFILTDGQCTYSIDAKGYTDIASRNTVLPKKNFIGGKDATGPLIRIIRDRTKSNVFIYCLSEADGKFEYKPELGEATGVYFLYKDTLSNYKLFINHVGNQIS